MKNCLLISIFAITFFSFAFATNATITDFYGNANNIDGGVQYVASPGITWQELMAAPGNRARSTADSELSVGTTPVSTTNLWQSFEKGIAIYGTDDGRIPSNAQILSATWYVWATYCTTGGSMPTPIDMGIYEAFPVSNTSLAFADYQNLGSTLLSDKVVQAIPGQMSLTNYTAFPFNAAGIALIQANVSNGQKTKIGITSPTYDVGGVTFPWAPPGYTHIHVHTMEASAGMQPYLRIEWTEGVPAPDTTPPARSNASPSGALASGTTQTTISLTTNENATCRYATTAGVGYDSILNAFSTTGGTSHSTLITGLINGTSYNYYIRCQDAAGNKNIDDFSISFSVAAPVPIDTTPPVISSIQSTNIAQTSATITWTTDDQSNSTLNYGLTASFGQTQSSASLVTIHSINLTNLTSNTTYYYQVRSCNSDNYCSNSATYSLNTLAPTTGNSTTPGILSLASTIENIGVVSNYTGDNNNNNSTLLEYRQVGTSNWLTAPEMYADRTNHQYRGSVFWLTTNTEYEVRVTYNDSDGGGTAMGTIRTRNDNPQSSGNSYHVSTTGNDLNPGTEAQPFRTIQKAADTVVVGDTVYIRGGTYSETVTIRSSGTATNYITFRNYGAEVVEITGSGTRANALVASQRSYFRLKGLTFRSTTSSLVTVMNGRGVIIEGCTFINDTMTDTVETASIKLRDYITDSLIQDNTFHTTAPGGTNAFCGIAFRNAYGGHVIRRNYFDGTTVFRDGIYQSPEDSTGYWQNNDIYENTIIGAQDDGIQSDGSGINVRIWSNRIQSGFRSISITPLLQGPTYIFRNTILLRGSVKTGNSNPPYVGRSYWYHNTFWLNASDVAEYGNSGNVGNFIFKNNIMRGARYIWNDYVDGPPGSEFDYDFMFTTDPARFFRISSTENYTSFTTLRAGRPAFEAHGFNSEAGLVDPINGDARLQSTSPAIDKGVILLGFNDPTSPWPYKGLAPDIGAYEYDSGSPPPVQNIVGDIWGPAGTKDGKVNIYDVSRLMSKWGSTNLTDLTECDINPGPSNLSQNKIDLYDANLMMRNWLP